MQPDWKFCGFPGIKVTRLLKFGGRSAFCRVTRGVTDTKTSEITNSDSLENLFGPQLVQDINCPLEVSCVALGSRLQVYIHQSYAVWQKTLWSKKGLVISLTSVKLPLFAY